MGAKITRGIHTSRKVLGALRLVTIGGPLRLLVVRNGLRGLKSLGQQEMAGLNGRRKIQNL